jgi:AcrR family transcriptional regulator
MASQTFYNLKSERRKEIIQVSLEEFAVREYDNASLSSIITKLGLAKGSFYRYFENKKSLYLYLLDHAMAFRLNKEKNILDGSIPDFFDMMISNFAARIQFDIDYPIYSAFLYNVMQEKNSPELGNIQLQVRSRILELIIPLMEKESYRKALRTDISADILAFTVMQVHLGIYDYLQWKYGLNIHGSQGITQPDYGISQTEIMEIARSFVTILKSGLT